MKRIALYILTNLAVLLVINITMRLFMTHPPLDERIAALCASA